MGKLYLKLSLILFLGIALASCDSSIMDQGTPSEINSSTADQQLAIEESSLEGEYIMLFKGNKIPNNFDSDVDAAGGTIIYQHDSGFAYVGGLSEEAATTFSARKDIAEFAANESFSLDIQNEPVTLNADFGVDSTEDPAGAFFYARQWNLSAIEADKAWDAGLFGDESVTVGILDSGIDYLHADLSGLVDLSRSVSFVPTDDALVDAFFPGAGLDYSTDIRFHGTHVAATVASNAFAAAGVTSKTTLTSIKVCNILGSCSFGAIFSGLLHAIETDVDIANMSLGGAFTKAGNGQFLGFINSLMNSVRQSGTTVVVSAGNSAIDLDKNGNSFSVFCDSPNVICVSATGPTSAASVNGPWTDVDAPAGYTNYGRSAIDVAAPGGSSGGAVWAACPSTSVFLPVEFGFSCGTTSILGLSGTSMAAPHVSGLAALLVSQGVDKPSQVKARILQSADDLGQKGTDKFYGKGRINVANALGL